MRGPLAGLGYSAAARAIHKEASPGLRLRTKAHGPLQKPSSRYQNPLRLRVLPRSIPLTHTQKNPSGVSTTQPRTPSMHTPSHSPMLPRARERLGHKTRASTHTYVMSARARVGGSRPAVLPVASPSVPPPTPLSSYWPDREGGGGYPLPSPSLPIGQTVGRAPPSIGYSRRPLPAADSPLAENRDRETLLGNGAGDPDHLFTPPQLFVPTVLAGCALPVLKAQPRVLTRL